MTKNEIIKVLKYWYTEEFLLPQPLEPVEKLNNENQQSFTGTLEYIIEEMEKFHKDNQYRKADNDYVWEFIIYGLMYKIEEIKTILLSALKVNDDFEARIQHGNAASYTLSFNSYNGLNY